jgi:hypothetical protein
VILLDALKSPAVRRPIFVDQAAVVGAEKLAPPVYIRQHHLHHALPGMVDGDIDRERTKARMLVRLEQDGKVMPVLPAAVRAAALAAGAFAEDGNSETSHEAPNSARTIASRAKQLNVFVIGSLWPPPG